MRQQRDRHHLLHERVEWTARPQAKYIREHPSLIPLLEREDHEALHAACPSVPLLGYYALVRTARMWQPQTDTLHSVSSLMGAMEVAAAHPKAHEVERGVIKLAVHALDLQRQFLKGRIVNA